MTAHATPPAPAADKPGTPLIDPGITAGASGAIAEAAEERSRLAGRVLADALLLGIVGDALLRVSSWGANLTIWSLAVVAAVLTLARRRHDGIPSEARWLTLPAVALALMFVWRDSESLAAYNTLALLGTLALLAGAVSRGSGTTLAGIRVRDLVHRVVTAAAGTLFGMLPLVLADASVRDVARGRGAARLIAAVRAALIAIPLLLVFGGLFASADPVFARIAGEVFRLDPGVIASHLIVSGVVAWLVGGYLRRATLGSPGRSLNIPFPDGALGLTEVAVSLGSLVLLFASFVAIQLRYFFGGNALVQATAGMSYASYARRGFFELVTVSALVLPVLLAAGALLRRDRPRATRVYRALAVTLIALLGVIMYSALARMLLYQAAYGLTTDRIYATVFMAWLALAFVWFCATMLRGRERLFCGGLLVSAWGVVAFLNALGPEGAVIRFNIARAERGQGFDARYAASLGADAAPALVSYLVTTPPTEIDDDSQAGTPSGGRSADDVSARCYAARTLLESSGPAASRDWRGWTISRAAARRAVAANEPALRRMASLAAPGAASVPCPPTLGERRRAASATAAGISAAAALRP